MNFIISTREKMFINKDQYFKILICKQEKKNTRLWDIYEFVMKIIIIGKCLKNE